MYGWSCDDVWISDDLYLFYCIFIEYCCIILFIWMVVKFFKWIMICFIVFLVCGMVDI